MQYCKTCELIVRRDANFAPLWDSIHRTRFWDIVHHNSTTLPGWLVLGLVKYLLRIFIASAKGCKIPKPLNIKRSSLCLKKFIPVNARSVANRKCIRNGGFINR